MSPREVLHPRHSALILSVLVSVTMLVVIFFYNIANVYLIQIGTPPEPFVFNRAVSSQEERSEGGLGAELFEKTEDPVSGNLPEVPVSPVVNPLEGVYTNPFE